VRYTQTMNIFITGASSGIGEALAHEYAKRALLNASENNASGSRSVIGLAARRIDMLQKLAQTLQQQYQVQTAIYAVDVRDKTALANAAEDFIKRFGAPNIVIASAGVSRGTLTEHQEDISAFQAVFDINVMGMVQVKQGNKPNLSAWQVLLASVVYQALGLIAPAKRRRLLIWKVYALKCNTLILR
jgi:NADP-dependent 3-hydroxy acid dehydrogenase YdfG